MRISFSGSNFRSPYGRLNNMSEFTLTWAQLVWGALTVGRANMLDVLRHGRSSRFEIIYRAAMLYANITEQPNHTVRKSAAYNALDPSEKGAVSYFLGMTIAKAFSDVHLRTPWLLHLDVYRNTRLRAVALQGGRSRPDLVGLTRGLQWVVIEPKGRTNGLGQSALTKARDQAKRVTTVEGMQPVANAGMVAHFQDGRLSLAADDPVPSRTGKHIDLDLTAQDFFNTYYEPFRRLVAEERHSSIKHDGDEYQVVTIPLADVSVGIRSDLVKTSSIDKGYRRRQADEMTYLGGDGLLVELGPTWNQELMMMQPHQRSEKLTSRR